MWQQKKQINTGLLLSSLVLVAARLFLLLSFSFRSCSAFAMLQHSSRSILAAALQGRVPPTKRCLNSSRCSSKMMLSLPAVSLIRGCGRMSDCDGDGFLAGRLRCRGGASSFPSSLSGGCSNNNNSIGSRLFSATVDSVSVVDEDTLETLADSSTSEKGGDSTSLQPERQQQQQQQQQQTTVLAREDEFIKSDPDRRNYRAVRLHNGLEVLLVSDPITDVEAGAVHVKAGHFHDLPHRPGLAHFHEHMLFLGTAKYPEEDAYESYLSKNGGSSNAYTDMEDTNYYFSVSSSDSNADSSSSEEVEVSTNNNKYNEVGTSPALSGALDRFAQFFIEPSFRADMVERELRAVDSEYQNSINSDAWRSFQLLKNGANPEHPFHKFGCGNYHTLTNGGTRTDTEESSAERSGGSSPREDLIQFWKMHYKTHNMKLCVVGRASLDELQSTVEETFGPLAVAAEKRERKAKENQLFVTENAQYRGIRAFGPEQLGKIREVKPILETRLIRISFAFPPMDDPHLRESRPMRVISHLLGHEAPGSLHALLSDEGLINSLSSGSGIETSDFSLFSVSLSLTPQGMKERDRVLDLTFQWVSLIKGTISNDHHGMMEKYHNEIRQISETNFRYRENGDPTDFASGVAEQMFYHPPAKVLSASSTTGEYDAEVAMALLDRLRPENALITVVNSDLEIEAGVSATTEDAVELTARDASWQQEKWYRAMYREIKIPEKLCQKWNERTHTDPNLHLPVLNEFIPKDFSLRCEDSEIVATTVDGVDYAKQPPQVLIDRPDLRLWLKLDRTWKVPKASIRMHITSPTVYQSPRTMTLNRIFQKVLRDDLNSYLYDASIAGANYRIGCSPSGYKIDVNGYSEKLPFLLDAVTSRMLSLMQEMREGPEAHPALARKFRKATENLLRQTKNYKLDGPHEVNSYNSRLLLEQLGWYVDDYIAEMEGEVAEKDPLTMEDCANVAEECIRGRIRIEALCMGNVDEEWAKNAASVIETNFLQKARPLLDDEVPIFKSMRLPTRSEAVAIFGPEVENMSIPVVVEDFALSESEENDAVELIVQAGSSVDLGYEGVAILDLIGYLAYNSAFNQLRTKEQLGYLVSAFVRKTAGGAWGLSVVVQSGVADPVLLQQRIEAWLSQFREELAVMSEENLAMEASAVAAQLLEKDTTLFQEIASSWGEIVMTEPFTRRFREPAFDRLERIAEVLTIKNDDEEESSSKKAAELKKQVLDFFDKHLSDSPSRRAMVARCYGQKNNGQYDANVGKPGVLSKFSDLRHVKQYFSAHPIAPFWRKDTEGRTK